MRIKLITLVHPESMHYNGYIIQPTPLGYYVYARIDTRIPIGKMCPTFQDAINFVDYIAFGEDEDGVV